MRPVLFISHDASRTGAPMVLLNLCRWLHQNHCRGFEFALGDGGDLETEFAALAATTTIGRLADPARAAVRMEALGARVAAGEFSLIYANTVETGEILEACASPSIPVLTHVHELEFRIRHQTGLERFGRVRRHTDRFIAVSDAVRNNLVTNHGIDAQTIDLVHEFIETSRWPAERARYSPLRRALDIDPSALVVGGAGTLDWRKGPDLFVQVAGAVGRRPPRLVHWVWVGGHSEGLEVAALRHDAARLGIEPVMHFVGEQREPAPFFALFDLFLSTSREDPYPLVNLEAAASAIPIVCFEGAGGAREFVEHDCGAVVPYLDIAAMADSIVDLLSSDRERRACGDRARAKVQARHDVSTAGLRVAEMIEASIVAGPSAARRARTASRPSSPRTPAPVHPSSGDGTMLTLYRLASAYASSGHAARARALFETIVDGATETDPALSGKAWFKLAGLDVPPAEAIRCCERALELLPTHRAARQLRDTLMAAETIHV